MASRRFRSRKVPRFSPSGDDQIGEVRGSVVFMNRVFREWLDMVAVRLENLITPIGTLQMTTLAEEPEGWLFYNGQQVDGRKYRALGEKLGQTGDIITLPDYRDRIAMGAGNIVALGGFAGAAQVVLTVEQLARHAHPIIDLGHKHAAIDRGHTHDLHIDSHSHEAGEDPAAKHVHGITDPGHAHGSPNHLHGGGASFTAGNELAAGSDHPRAEPANTGSAGVVITSNTTGITGTGEATADLEIIVEDAEINGTASAGRSDIRVHDAKTGISMATEGDNAPIDIVPPVFGINWMVKT